MTLLTRTNGNLESMFNDFVGGDFYMTPKGFYSGVKSIPAVNVYENDNSYTIELAAPGLLKSDFNIEFNNGKLVISASKVEESKKEKVKSLTKEFNYGNFKKEFTVSKQKVDETKIEANYQNGILNVLLPKREEIKVKPKRVIEIN